MTTNRIAIACTAIVACSQSFSATLAPRAVTLAVAGRANATPSIAADGDTVAVAWSASLPGGGTDVFVAVSRDGGSSFGAATRVNDVPGDARVNGEQPPRVALPRGAVTVVWTSKGVRGTRLLQSTSTDGGRTFAKAAAVPGGDAAGARGWQNIAAGGANAERGRTYAVWLDHRELAQQDGEVAASHHDHAAGAPQSAGKPDGVATAQKSKLYVASLDGVVAPRAIAAGVCYCCKTAIAVGNGGTVFAAWRHVYPGNIRDVAFTGSRDAGRTFAPPIRVSDDKWVLEGCPDDGPAMAVDDSGRIHIVWPTLLREGEADTMALFYATSADGKSFTARERIPTEGMPHHPQIAIGAGGAAIVVWDESAKGVRRAALSRVSPNAEGRPQFARIPLGERAVYPVVAAAANATIVAWTATDWSGGSTIHVERR